MKVAWQLLASRDVEFAEDVAEVPLDGLGRDVQIVTDLGIRSALGREHHALW